MAKAGVVNVCIHKGLFPPSLDQKYPHLRPYCDVRDVGKAAKDWPQLNFIIYHGAYRFPGGGDPAESLDQKYPHLRPYCDVRDVGKAAKDWPQLNFIIYHGAYRFPGGGDPAEALD